MSKFQAGQSGNPKGRPRGTRSALAAALDQAAESDAREVLDVLLTQARGGDVRSAELIFNRVWPAVRERPLSIKLPPLTDAEALPEAVDSIVQAVASGDLLPGEGQALVALIDAQRRAIETADLATRLTALEALLCKHD